MNCEVQLVTATAI